MGELQNRALELAGQEERVDDRSLEVQREEALSLGYTLKAEELNREPELKLGPAAMTSSAGSNSPPRPGAANINCSPSGALGCMRCSHAKSTFAEMRERLEMARDAWAEAREESYGHVSAGLAVLRAVAGRQAKELDQDEIKQRLARIAGHEAGADAIPDRLKQVLGRDRPDPR